MIVLEGAAALSPFRRQRLQDRLQTLVPGLRIEGAWYVYFVQPGAGAPDTAALHRILQAGQAEAPRAAGALSRYVVPRLGTRSPWSSKATELLHGAGLDVARVERGLRLDLTGWPRDPAAQAAAARLLHDPMTQSLLDAREQAQALFAAPPRRPLERVALARLEDANARLGLALAQD